ncbi:hypothetical protein, partial [Acinetobacter sp.]|uniref:hypothetical protein n=1 Tax=Acinetobacter sp. TaxID=472 RepID=UPI002FCA5C0A
MRRAHPSCRETFSIAESALPGHCLSAAHGAVFQLQTGWPFKAMLPPEKLKKQSAGEKKPQTMFEAFLNMVARPRIELGT